MKRVAFLLAACFFVACGEDAPGPVTFSAEAPSGDGTPTVFLRGQPDGERVTVDVVARDVGAVHGTALRITWNPAELTHLETKQSLVWSKTAVFLAKEGTPGQLAIAWTEKGPSSKIDAASETVLGTMVFEVRGRAGSAIAFRTERSAIVDPDGKRLAVTFKNGAVPAR